MFHCIQTDDLVCNKLSHVNVRLTYLKMFKTNTQYVVWISWKHIPIVIYIYIYMIIYYIYHHIDGMLQMSPELGIVAFWPITLYVLLPQESSKRSEMQHLEGMNSTIVTVIQPLWTSLLYVDAICDCCRHLQKYMRVFVQQYKISAVGLLCLTYRETRDFLRQLMLSQ